jgi:acyl-CoA thioesterase
MEAPEIAKFFGRDAFARENGIRVVEVRLGFARTEMTVEPRHLNSVGIMQGGALFTLADLAFAGASNSHGVVAVACQADMTFFKAVQTGTLTATAEEIARTRRLSTCLIRVTGDDGRLRLWRRRELRTVLPAKRRKRGQTHFLPPPVR